MNNSTSSDILCLKEPKFGENDGSQIFSMNVSPFSRKNRCQHQNFDVFQFDLRPKTEESPKMTEIDEIDHPEPVDKEEKQEIIMFEKASREPTVSSSSMKRNPVTGVGLEADEHHERRHYVQQPDKCMY